MWRELADAMPDPTQETRSGGRATDRHIAARYRRYTAPVSLRMHRRRGNVRRRRVVLGTVVALVALGVVLVAIGGGSKTATRLSPTATTGTAATTVTPTSQPPSPPFAVGTVSFTCRVHLFVQCPDLELHGAPACGYDHR